MKKKHKPTFHNRGPLYFKSDGTPKTEENTVEKIPKVGLDAYTELGESHEAHVRQVKKLEEELLYYKRLDCEGISINEEKGKITISEDHRDFIERDLNVRYYNEFIVLSIIDWIQDTQSEMDLQTKTNDEILEEYYENN